MLEYRNFSPLLVFDVFINCEEAHEGKEETGSTKEVPNIVPEKGGEMIHFIFFAALPVVVAEQLTVLVEVPRLRRGDVGVLLLLHKEEEGGECADEAADCGRNTQIKKFAWQILVVSHPDKALTGGRAFLQRCTS